MTAPPRAAASMRRSDTDATLVEATDLLNIELPDRRWADESHLAWLYGANPFGRGILGFRRSGDRLDAHYANIPQRYRTPHGEMNMMFSLNAVTRGVAQRQGHFWSIAEEVYERAASEYGAHGVIGVSNDNSTPPVVKKLDFRLLGPLPVKIIPRGPALAGVTHSLVDAEWLTSGAANVLDGLDHPVPWGWRNRMTREYLTWRLSSPNTEPFHIHVSPELIAMSVPSHLGPLAAAVVVKLIPRFDRRVLSAGPLISAICAHHGAGFAVYAGFNDRVPVRGLRPPRRLQPAPLNLIYRSLDNQAAKHEFRLETFEFLDMDAY